MPVGFRYQIFFVQKDCDMHWLQIEMLDTRCAGWASMCKTWLLIPNGAHIVSKGTAMIPVTIWSYKADVTCFVLPMSDQCDIIFGQDRLEQAKYKMTMGLIALHAPTVLGANKHCCHKSMMQTSPV